MRRHARVGDLGRLEQITAEVDPKSVLLFTGAHSYRSSGAAATIDPLVRSFTNARITDIEPNPTIEAVEAACVIHAETGPDLIIAVGGGSVIDLAKGVGALAPQTRPPRDIVLDGGRGIDHPGVPLVAIPTTAGTGSETTHFAVVYVDGRKYSLSHEFVRPDHVILDPTLTYTLPPAITAATGLDALSQAIESYWSVHSSELSTGYAASAMDLASKHLSEAVHHPDAESRLGMCEASHLAGRAIDITTTTAPHALSYTLTSEFGVPHGTAVALTLGAVLEHNAGVNEEDCNDQRGVDHVRSRVEDVVALFGASDASSARAAIERLVASLGLPSSLSEVGAGSAQARRRIAESVDGQRLSGNPRSFTPDQLRSLVDSLD